MRKLHGWLTTHLHEEIWTFSLMAFLFTHSTSLKNSMFHFCSRTEKGNLFNGTTDAFGFDDGCNGFFEVNAIVGLEIIQAGIRYCTNTLGIKSFVFF